MIIRHGEKPEGDVPGIDASGNEDDSSLTEVGWQRAHLLVDVFDPAQGAPRAGLARPAAIYAAGVTDDGEGQRTRETVAPLADRLGIPVDTEYGRGQEKKLVDRVVDEQGPVLISWQHGGITEIADAFPSVKPKPPSEWPDDRFDVIWTFTRTEDGWRFAQIPEDLLPGDSTEPIEK
jgi:broad specificity phosphatase PhoE